MAARRIPLGHRIRARRRELAIRQVDLAARVGISPSYLNMIEHDRRTVAGGLLLRLAQALQLDLARLSGSEEVRLLAQISELAADPALADHSFDSGAAADLVGHAPDAARAMLALYHAYRQAREAEAVLRDSLAEDPLPADVSHQILTMITSIRAFAEILADYDDLREADRRRYVATVAEESRRLSDSTRELFAVASGRRLSAPHPAARQEIEDFLQDRRNHFPELEAAAERLHQDTFAGAPVSDAALAARLAEEHGLAVEIVPPERLDGAPEELFRVTGRLALAESLPPESRRFRLARCFARHAAADALDAALAAHRFRSPGAETLAREIFVSYLAGALLMPYAGFRDAAESLGYDIERLQQRFAASFEQVCHRLTTLSRPGAEGIAFHFLRRDAAGNLSKRFSASGLALPHYSAACTRWALHAAFLTPGQIVAQVARLPDDSRYLFVARTTSSAFGYGAPGAPRAVMLGCTLAQGARTVYAAHAAEVPVGITCNLCPRRDCGERAAPWLETTAAE